MESKTLTEEQRRELVTWSPDFLGLPVHCELEHQMRMCMEGIEQALVIGARGVGKTHAVQWFCAEIQAAEVEHTLADPAYQPREVLYYATSRAGGTKTGLIDLYERLYGGHSKAALRFRTPTSLIAQIVMEVQRRGIVLICIDEAQMIDGPNLDLLRQVPDAAREAGHLAGLMLIGSEELRDSLAAIKQLGQRFSGEVRFPPLDRAQIGPHLPGFHPHLAAVQKDLKPKDWDRLEAELFLCARGTFRRLLAVLRNANALALRLGRPLDAEVLRLAIAKLASED